MNFSCNKTLLYEATSTASRSIPVKSTLPALEGLLFDAQDDDKLIITGFDMEMGITVSISAEVKIPVSFIINAKLINDILRTTEEGEIQFFINKNKTVTLICGSSDYCIPFIDAESFPDMPVIDREKSINLKQDKLSSMLRQTSFAMAQNDARVVLNGALFNIDKDLFEIVCTDTYKLAIRRERYENGDESTFYFIVPGKVVGELIRIMKNEDEDVIISLSKRHIVFEFNNIRIISRLIEGQFINYTSILPKGHRTKSVINVAEFKKSIDRASVLINEKSRKPVRLNFEFETTIVSCRTADGQTFTDELPNKSEGDNIEIGVNNRHFLEMLNSCECEEVTVYLNTPLSSIKIEPKEGDAFTFLISPMRLKND